MRKDYVVPVQAEVLRRMLRYDPASGCLYWKEHRQGRVMDRPAGTVNRMGDRYIGVAGQQIKASHIVWAMHTDRQTFHRIKNLNNRPDDNRIENLVEIVPVEGKLGAHKKCPAVIIPEMQPKVEVKKPSEFEDTPVKVDREHMKRVVVREHFWRPPNTKAIVCAVVLRNGSVVLGEGLMDDHRDHLDRAAAIESARAHAWQKARELEEYVALDGRRRRQMAQIMDKIDFL